MRQSTKTLPEGYRLDADLDLKKRKGLALGLNLLAAAAVIGYAVLFLMVAQALRPADAPTGLRLEISGAQGWVVLVRLAIVTVAMLLIHEGVHGLAFRLYTGEWGTFAFKGLYAYAAAPDWYLLRSQHLVTALAPYLGLSLAGVLLMLVIPGALLPDLLLFLILNAAGATGDLAVVVWLLTKPATALVNDYGDGVAVYVPGEGAGSILG